MQSLLKLHRERTWLTGYIWWDKASSRTVVGKCGPRAACGPFENFLRPAATWDLLRIITYQCFFEIWSTKLTLTWLIIRNMTKTYKLRVNILNYDILNIVYFLPKEGSTKEWHAKISGENSEGEMLKSKTTISSLILGLFSRPVSL